MINRFSLEMERFLCYADMNPLGSPEICEHEMCWDLEPELFNVTIDNIRYQPQIPGRVSGPPENCYPDEPEEFEYEYDPPVQLSKAEEESIENEIRDRFYESTI